MKINKDTAKVVLLEEAEKEKHEAIHSDWEQRISDFSEICESTSKTHIAFLGTALLAKSIEPNIDAFSVKAGDDSEGAYSARSLAHDVLVPMSSIQDINLGVTGREPLNNQPYFRIKRVTEDVPVKGNAKIALDKLIVLLRKINELQNVEDARQGLRAFIHVRRRYSPSYADMDENSASLSIQKTIEIINRFVSEKSEGGKRAQAIVAGVLDLFSGSDRVVSGRINDPDHHLPGDVGVRRIDNSDVWEKVFEVRDKPVSAEDLYLFVNKARENGVKDVAVVSVNLSQQTLNTEEIKSWASERDINIEVFQGWEQFLQQVIFWSEMNHSQGLDFISQSIHKRLIEIEVEEATVEKWVAAFRQPI